MTAAGTRRGRWRGIWWTGTTLPSVCSLTRATGATALRFAPAFSTPEEVSSSTRMPIASSTSQSSLTSFRWPLRTTLDRLRVYRYDTMVRSMVSWVYNRLVGVLFRVGVRDVDCAFKLIRREVVDKLPLQSDDFFIDTEIVACSEVELPHRAEGRSSLPAGRRRDDRGDQRCFANPQDGRANVVAHLQAYPEAARRSGADRKAALATEYVPVAAER